MVSAAPEARGSSATPAIAVPATRNVRLNIVYTSFSLVSLRFSSDIGAGAMARGAAPFPPSGQAEHGMPRELLSTCEASRPYQHHSDKDQRDHDLRQSVEHRQLDAE